MRINVNRDIMMINDWRAQLGVEPSVNTWNPQTIKATESFLCANSSDFPQNPM